MARDKLKSPYPYFGGKGPVARLIWGRFGDPENVIEPFAGSAVFLLARPTPPRIETLNDVCVYIANFWRAVRSDPGGVAWYASTPVDEADMHARHRWLVGIAEPEPVVPPEWDRHPTLRRAYLAGYARQDGSYAAAFRRRMRRDPDYFDPKVAGWWVHGMCAWIGSGWCSVDELRVDASPREKISAKRPILAAPGNEHGRRSHLGQGVHSKGPELSEKRPNITHAYSLGVGVHGVHGQVPEEKRPHIATGNGWGTGINRNPDGRRPQLADAYSRGRGVHGNDDAGTCAARLAWLTDWFGRLADRLRTVRVCCGDWRRVCGSPSVTTRLGTTAIFFDPPYGEAADRTRDLYGKDSLTVAADVRAYCLEHGADPRFRICLAGYAGEGHEILEQHGWECVAWSSHGGYGNRTEKGRTNAVRERLWFSPGCIKPGAGAMLPFMDPGDDPGDA